MSTSGTVRSAAPGRGLALVGLSVTAAAAAAAVLTAICLLPLGVGVVLLPPAARWLRTVANRARDRAGRWSGVAIPAPAATTADGPRWRICYAILIDPAMWREVRWALIDPLTGSLLAATPAGLIVFGLFGAVVQPFVWRPIDEAGGSNWYAMIHVNSTGRALAAVPLAAAFLAAGVWFGPALLRTHARLTRALLAPGREELAERVERLTQTRTQAVDVQAAELRRIERDLHDGAQARLVAMGMSLDSAERLLDEDPAAARTLLTEARQASTRALSELRDLVRGIHPPVLADRGLRDAVRALALDSLLDVDVHGDLPGRPAAPVEAAAYFAVSEALANAAKHSGGRHVVVTFDYEATGKLMRLTIADDGHGGADPAAGTGLTGIRNRLAPFDGTVAVSSPPGGPTIVTLEIPCELSSPKT
ncbi:sensor histidine kinase [Hamadaea tsunoensis]|uniref:sensor histidine kinase n=1 Tax=Hamadaea tsunoensis TaxID=53368 RepID=UPI000428587E|nr:sensor histidine kinase [Hamadaea tsunoensis]